MRSELSFEAHECLAVLDEPADDKDWLVARNRRGKLGQVPRINMAGGRARKRPHVSSRAPPTVSTRFLSATGSREQQMLGVRGNPFGNAGAAGTSVSKLDDHKYGEGEKERQDEPERAGGKKSKKHH